MHACMYVCTYVSTYACMHVCMCVYVRMYTVFTFVCKHVSSTPDKPAPIENYYTPICHMVWGKSIPVGLHISAVWVQPGMHLNASRMRLPDDKVERGQRMEPALFPVLPSSSDSMALLRTSRMRLPPAELGIRWHSC